MAAGIKIAADVGACICFQDETGQGLSPPKGRTWGRRGKTPVMLVWVWDNLPVHLTGELTDFIAENTEWLTVFQLPAYAPELNPVEGVWSLTKRSLENFAAASLDHLVLVLKRKLKKIQYRPHLLQGCLAETGLIIENTMIEIPAITS